MMPINTRYPLAELMAACRTYIERTHSRVSFEYALIDGVNASGAEARRLARLLQEHALPPQKCHVNVIPLNSTPGFAGRAAAADGVREFLDAFGEASPVRITARVRRGIDIAAGCGQLAAEDKPASGAAGSAGSAGSGGSADSATSALPLEADLGLEAVPVRAAAGAGRGSAGPLAPA
eukprot:m.44788 g.44788  ORF g.44788 m.44788 type:complete len:178 (+) comp5843_c0_seq1:1333-1866(+)